jgi:hypothetical protein
VTRLVLIAVLVMMGAPTRAGSAYSAPVRLSRRLLPAAAALRFQVFYVVPKDVARRRAGAIRVRTFRFSRTRAALQSSAYRHDALDDVRSQLGNSGLLAARDKVWAS